jgi:signal transduction histidine kinase
LSNDNVTSILQDTSGTIWVGMLGGLERFDPQSNGFTHYRNVPNDPASLSSDAVSTLFEDSRCALAEMRTLLVELRPNALVDVPLPTLLKQLCESFIGRARLPVQLNVEGKRPLPPDVQLAYSRITQEALNNIVKHAKAT